MDLGELAGLLGGFFEKALANRKSEEEDRFDAVCPRCGMTYAEFRRGGMLGCADCYRAFHKPLEELLVRVSGNAQHTGRKVAVKMAIDRKKQKLMRAIAEEEYETAAALRDEIRALTAQLEAMNAEAEAGKEEASDE